MCEVVQYHLMVNYKKVRCINPKTQTEKNLPAMQETQVRSLGWEDPLEKGVATHSSILAWEISRTEEPGRLHTLHRVLKEWDLATKQLPSMHRTALRRWMWHQISSVISTITEA